MALLKTKLCAAAIFSTFAGTEAYDLVTPDERQLGVWEIIKHPSYETIHTVRHRYNGTVADPMEVYIQTDRAGEPIDFQWTSSVYNVPREMREQTSAWTCTENERGILELKNEFTGEVIPPMDLRLAQPVFSDRLYCSAESRQEGFIGVYAMRP
jgi:hypothetical protein